MPDETLPPEKSALVTLGETAAEGTASPEMLGQAAPGETAPEEPHEAETNHTTFSEYLESLLVTVILALFGTSFVVQAFKFPSLSMEGTLLVGDHLLVNIFIFGGRGAWYD